MKDVQVKLNENSNSLKFSRIYLDKLKNPATLISIILLFIQMPGTFLPLVLFPEICFTNFPFGLTLEGQYIIKNLIIISAALVVGSTVRDKE